MNLSKAEIFAYNAGLNQAKWQITKAMLAMEYNDDMTARIKSLLKFIHDEIEKEKK